MKLLESTKASAVPGVRAIAFALRVTIWRSEKPCRDQCARDATLTARRCDIAAQTASGTAWTPPGADRSCEGAARSSENAARRIPFGGALRRRGRQCDEVATQRLDIAAAGLSGTRAFA